MVLIHELELTFRRSEMLFSALNTFRVLAAWAALSSTFKPVS